MNYFRENGYNVIMDVMVSEEITSQGPTRWGESQIRKANKVLIFLSRGLVNLALDGGAESQSQVDTFYSFFFVQDFVLLINSFFVHFKRESSSSLLGFWLFEEKLYY